MEGLIPAGNNFREYFICGGQVLFQGLILLFIKGNRRDYLGNMMTISLAGALLLLPGLALAEIFVLPPLFFAGYFIIIAGLMFLEHIRRTKLLKLGWIPTISWTGYRLLVLILIMVLN